MTVEVYSQLDDVRVFQFEPDVHHIFGVGTVGEEGDPGSVGQGVPVGGTIAQVLAKASGDSYDTEWVTLTPVADGTLKCALAQSTSPQQVTDNLGGGSVMSLSIRQALFTGVFAAADILTVKGAAAQSGPLIKVTDSADASIFEVGPAGALTIGAADLVLGRYYDGLSVWGEITTGQGFVAPAVMIGGQSGLQLTQDGTYIEVRNTADSAYSSLRCLSMDVENRITSDTIRSTNVGTALQIQTRNRSTAGHSVDVGSITASNSTGEYVACALEPTINQSGDASAVCLLVNPAETALGSGGLLLADFQVGDSSKASIDNAGVWISDNFKRGSGSPEGAVNGNIGDAYLSTAGGASTTLYVKESGAGTNTGWVAK